MSTNMLIAKNEIADAFLDATIGYYTDGNRVYGAKTHAWEIADEIIALERTCTLILRSTGTGFSVKKFGKNGKPFVHKTSLGHQIFLALLSDQAAIQRHFSQHELNPVVDLFIRHAEQCGVFKLVWQMKNGLLDHELTPAVERLSSFVEAIRKEGKSQKFQTSLKKFTRNINKKHLSFCQYFDQISSKHKKLLPICLCLSYKKSKSWPQIIDNSITFHEVKKHRDQFFKILHKAFPQDDLLGFAYRIDYGLEPGFNIHLLVLLNAEKCQEAITAAQIIGNLWNKVVPAENGQYCNYNSHPICYYLTAYSNLLGQDISEDQRKVALGDLKRSFGIYLIKVDFYAKYKPPGNGRIFDRGVMPKKKKSITGTNNARTGKIKGSNLK
jgi:hypothetical protein